MKNAHFTWNRRSPLAILAALLVSTIPSIQSAKAQTSPGFTIEQAMSAPFTEHLSPAPAGGKLAWVADIGGRRNIWIAEPSGTGSGYHSRQLTKYSDDDGQELSTPQWTPDASTIVYVRGGSVEGESHPVPNPAWFPMGAHQQIWAVSSNSGDPRLIAEGQSPAVSPDGKTIAYLSKGQIWTASLDPKGQKPEQLLQLRGSVEELRWSPDGAHLAFVSIRDDHSFIAVYSPSQKSISYLDPSTDFDTSFTWSPDSRRIAFLRVPSVRDAILFEAHREGPPWSIRIADIADAKSREIWRAAEGPGSVYRGTDSDDQLHWVAGDQIVFPWEHDGWLHFYSVSTSGGSASLLTPGGFEVEHVSSSADRKTVVFDSNQGDIDRRHVWKLTFAEGSAGNLEQVTSGEGIETQPAVASDNKTIAVLRSDTQIPMRAAEVSDGKLVDLAPQAIPPDFPGSRFVTPQQVIFSAADGLPIHGQLFLPRDLKPGEHRPAAIFFHGGSQREMLLGWHYMEYYSNAYAMNQYLAGKGYIVLSVNYRSGIGYGLNFREALNYGATGASEFNDVMGAGLYLRSRSDVDGKRIASWGGSYGGYLTALALARASDLFAAGVDMHGVHDWNIEIPTFSPRYDPAQRPEAARLAFASSPMASISTWRSPVLLIQGDDDRNVSFSQTVQLAEALRKQGVAYEELIFPDEIHDFLLRRDWVRAYTASADFLDRKLNAGQAADNEHHTK